MPGFLFLTFIWSVSDEVAASIDHLSFPTLVGRLVYIRRNSNVKPSQHFSIAMSIQVGTERDSNSPARATLFNQYLHPHTHTHTHTQKGKKRKEYVTFQKKKDEKIHNLQRASRKIVVRHQGDTESIWDGPSVDVFLNTTL